MKPRVMFGFILVLMLTFDFAACFATQPTVNTTRVAFGTHDIGTATARSVTIYNRDQNPIDIEVAIDDIAEFAWTSGCLKGLPSRQTCTITIAFTPLTVSSEQRPTEAKLQVSTPAGTEPITIELSGVGFPNLLFSPELTMFEDQLVGSTSAAKSITVINRIGKTLTAVNIASSGDFTELHPECKSLPANGSCSVSVSFAPKHEGENEGALTVSATAGAEEITRSAGLRGRSIANCVQIGFGWGRGWAAFLICLVYLMGMMLVRWHMIAKPTRSQLLAEIECVRARLIAESASLPSQTDTKDRIARIDWLLTLATYPLMSRSLPVDVAIKKTIPFYTRFFNALFWTRGQELAGWSFAHEAEQQLVALLPGERVKARMETAEQELRGINSPEAVKLADSLKVALQDSQAAASLDRWKALLDQALGQIYTRSDTDFYQMANWHNKLMWLVGCSILLILAVAFTVQNAILLLMGGVGGLLSRLGRNLQSADVPNDYGASWGSLFLSPVTGALGAWGGILLVILGGKFNILGPALNLNWCNPYEPATLGVALLFGFSERLFENVAGQLENKFSTPSTGAKGTANQPVTPPDGSPNHIGATTLKVTPGQNLKATLGKESTIQITGENFSPLTTVTFTDEQHNPQNAKVKFIDAKSLRVTFTPTGAAAYVSKLAIKSGDKSAETQCTVA